MTRLSALPLAILAILFTLVAFPSASRADQDDTYILRANDSITVTMFNQPSTSGTVRILRTGQAPLPLLEPITLAGLSVRESAEKIREAYIEAEMFVNPQVTVTVNDYATDYVSVLGSVRAPGQVAIPVNGHLDVAAAIASVGGLSEVADVNRIVLNRAAGGAQTFTEAGLRGAQGQIRLAAGDRLIVEEARFVNKQVIINGQVGRPGPIPFPADGNLDLVTAIALAGGTTQMARTTRVEINRRGVQLMVDYRDLMRRGAEPYRLMPDDIVTVPERLF